MPMRLTRRRAIGAGLAAAASVALGGCRARAGALRFWAIGNEAMSLPALLDRLGIAGVDVQSLPWSAAHAKFLTAFAGDALPDLAQVGNSWLAELDAIGALEPVPARFAATIADQFDAVAQSNRIDGRLFGLPWYVDTRVQFYRTDMFARAGYAEPPLAWPDWKRALARIKQAQDAQGFAALLPLEEFEHLQGMALSTGARFLRDDHARGDFSSPEFRHALAFYKSLFDDGLAPVVTAPQIANRWSEFARGWFAVYPSGPWTVADMRRRLPPEAQDLWATAPNPGPNGAGAGAPGGSSLVVFARGERKRAAWDVIERLLTREAQSALNDATGNLPARRSAWRTARLGADPVFTPFARQLQWARPLPKIPEWERVVTEMQVVAQRMVRGEFTVPAAAAEMDRRVDAILAKRRWLLDRGAWA